MNLEQLFDDIRKDGLTDAVLSNPTGDKKLDKVKIRCIRIKDETCLQITTYENNQVFHSNCDLDTTLNKIEEWIRESFKQAQIETPHFRAVILVSKKGTMTVKKKQKTDGEPLKAVQTHNKEKKYILKEGEPVDFLIELSVMTEDGRVVKSKYDKFRQINRFLEFIEDVLPTLQDKEGPIRIIDFGCGKSYLTFAMYYYLHVIKKLELEIIGLDLKKDVIENCSKLASRLNYDGLRFEMGDIAGYRNDNGADMVVTLHACDTATDYALAQAVEWGAKVILSVPCCQHEVNRQIKCKELEAVLKYGILKERVSALFTDALRAELLKEQGYDTQILEFIDMEHTPKNILIRAVKRKGIRPAAVRGNVKKSEELASFLQVETTLQKLLNSKEF